uniref:Poly [ADP-ribose] polymerase n=1 Tax=Arcella intermedia TaxID=1963864 RepID=A0A6B2KZ36_9EUKA
MVSNGTSIFLVFMNCPPGYTKWNCLVIDECSLGTHRCSQICTHNDNGTTCGCYSGYTVDLQDPTICDDIDECANKSHTCEQICNNRPGNYTCSCTSLSTLNDDGHGCDCIPGYKKEGSICVDINECLDRVHNCTGEYRICINTDGSFLCPCTQGCQEVKGQCVALPCEITKSEWHPCPLNMCHVPSVYRTFNISRDTPHCPLGNFESVAYYETSDANTAIAELLLEYQFANFLKNQLNLEGLTLKSLRTRDNPPSIIITYTPTSLAKRYLICPSISHILLDSAHAILPMIDPLRLMVLNGTNNDSYCEATLQVQSSTNQSENSIYVVGVAVGASLGSIAFVAILIVVALVLYFYLEGVDDYSILPVQVRRFYELGRDNKQQWKKYEGKPLHYSLTISPASDLEKPVLEIFKMLQGEAIDIKSIKAVYNPALVKAFCSYRSEIRSKREKSPEQYNKTDWKKADQAELREYIMTEYDALISKYSWNKDNELAPIIPVIHGTTKKLALLISQNGFATSHVEHGFYGKGIYFTSSALYASPNYGSRSSPAIMICWLIPGNPYPVTEHPKKPEISLLGRALLPGYQSHYVLTNTSGLPIKSTKTKSTVYDEIVVENNHQVVPAFIIAPHKKHLAALMKQFDREVVRTNTTVNNKQNNFKDESQESKDEIEFQIV